MPGTQLPRVGYHFAGEVCGVVELARLDQGGGEDGVALGAGAAVRGVAMGDGGLGELSRGPG